MPSTVMTSAWPCDSPALRNLSIRTQFYTKKLRGFGARGAISACRALRAPLAFARCDAALCRSRAACRTPPSDGADAWSVPDARLARLTPAVAEHVIRARRAQAFVRAGRHAAAERLLRDVAAALARRQAFEPCAHVQIELGRLLLARGRAADGAAGVCRRGAGRRRRARRADGARGHALGGGGAHRRGRPRRRGGARAAVRGLAVVAPPSRMGRKLPRARGVVARRCRAVPTGTCRTRCRTTTPSCARGSRRPRFASCWPAGAGLRRRPPAGRGAPCARRHQQSARARDPRDRAVARALRSRRSRRVGGLPRDGGAARAGGADAVAAAAGPAGVAGAPAPVRPRAGGRHRGPTAPRHGPRRRRRCCERRSAGCPAPVRERAGPPRAAPAVEPAPMLVPELAGAEPSARRPARRHRPGRRRAFRRAHRGRERSGEGTRGAGHSPSEPARGSAGSAT